uniref:Uncharacterized protein n=1 Tax=Tanacetum cinerariifolium TaxID=118510 RepID=A0A699Q9W4_TANCI|nr:hypothetical protein [Tanacetum cinerariifolium]
MLRGSLAHHALSDGVSVSVPTVAPQLETSDEASPQLLSSLCAHPTSLAYDIKDAESAALGLQLVYAAGRV